MELRKANRRKTKLRIGLAGMAGTGKTLSALLMAHGLTSWDKIAIIDTENGSGDLYVGREINGVTVGEYNVYTLTAPFSPARYVEAIKKCERAGVEVIILDSISHEWEGAGGCLEMVDQLKMNSRSKDAFTQGWSKVTPMHSHFIQTILQSDCHVIATTRKKTEYAIERGDDGKNKPQKMGLKDITREGFDYEVTLYFEIEQNHLAYATKDRTGIFIDQPAFLISPGTGKTLLTWAETGVDAEARITEEEKQIVLGLFNKIMPNEKEEVLKKAMLETLKKMFNVEVIDKLKSEQAKRLIEKLEVRFSSQVAKEMAEPPANVNVGASGTNGGEIDMRPQKNGKWSTHQSETIVSLPGWKLKESEATNSTTGETFKSYTLINRHGVSGYISEPLYSFLFGKEGQIIKSSNTKQDVEK